MPAATTHKPDPAGPEPNQHTEQTPPKKPPSQRKVLANQLNAQHSTGPRTEAGKARSSQNATKHAFYSRRLVVPDHLREEHDSLLANLLAEYQPRGCHEESLFALVLHARWNLHRLQDEEQRLAQLGDPFADPTVRLNWTWLADQRRRYERSFDQALARFRAAQSNRINLERWKHVHGYYRPVPITADAGALLAHDARIFKLHPMALPAEKPQSERNLDEYSNQDLFATMDRYEAYLARLTDELERRCEAAKQAAEQAARDRVRRERRNQRRRQQRAEARAKAQAKAQAKAKAQAQAEPKAKPKSKAQAKSQANPEANPQPTPRTQAASAAAPPSATQPPTAGRNQPPPRRSPPKT